MTKTITVTYSASGEIGGYGGTKETIQLSADIDDFNNYPDTLEFLRSRVLDNLDAKIQERHEKLSSDFDETCKKFLDITEKLESAYKQWELVSNFLKTQGLKTDPVEFPQEALTNLSKSLPATSSGDPE